MCETAHLKSGSTHASLCYLRYYRFDNFLKNICVMIGNKAVEGPALDHHVGNRFIEQICCVGMRLIQLIGTRPEVGILKAQSSFHFPLQ